MHSLVLACLLRPLRILDSVRVTIGQEGSERGLPAARLLDRGQSLSDLLQKVLSDSFCGDDPASLGNLGGSHGDVYKILGLPSVSDTAESPKVPSADRVSLGRRPDSLTCKGTDAIERPHY